MIPVSIWCFRGVGRLMGLAWVVWALGGCGGESNRAVVAGGEAAQGTPGALTEEQIRNGIGPISRVEPGEIDPARVKRGEEIFALKCAACHRLDERYIGPPLREVTARRTPEFIMNMLLNSWEMTQRHPTVKEMLAEYFTPMPNQDLTEEDARAVLDYLRQARAEGGGGA